MPVFDLLVVGSGGGPSEVNSSGYLLKAHDSAWTDGIVGIEAGSGLGALARILRDNPKLLSLPSEPGLSAAKVYSNVRTYLITHAHLDHVLSLVLMAGSVNGPRKSIRGTRECLEDLQTIFAPSRIWPNLASWNPNDDDHLYLYDPLPDDSISYTPLLGSLSTRMMPLSHGDGYTSSAYFLRHETQLHSSVIQASIQAEDALPNPALTPRFHEFLFLGDVMPDSLSERPLTRAVWRAAAPKIPNELSAIFVECSWPSGRPDACLFGHLTPEHLVQELESLAACVVAYRSGQEQQQQNHKKEQDIHPKVVNGIDHTHTDTTHSADLEPEKEKGRVEGNKIAPAHKRRRTSTTASSEAKRPKHTRQMLRPNLRGALTGLRLYVMHCKEDMEGKYDRPMYEVITEQVSRLAAEKDLGVEVIAAVQGTIIQI